MLYSLSITKFRFLPSGSGLSLGLMISLKKVYKLFILISLFSFLLSMLFNIFGQNCLGGGGGVDFNFLNLLYASFCVYEVSFVRYACSHHGSLRSSAWVFRMRDGRLYVTIHTSVRTMIWATSRENLSSGFPTKRVSKQSPQLQRLARKLKYHL